MKQTPFNPETDLATTPFSQKHCEAARALKEAGLDWTPHVGCFVWDPNEHIAPTSPFPNRIYFMLNVGRFLQTFETLDAIKEKLVWLPTWHQARSIAAKLGITDEEIKAVIGGTTDEMLALYSAMLNRLTSK